MSLFSEIKIIHIWCVKLINWKMELGSSSDFSNFKTALNCE